MKTERQSQDDDGFTLIEVTIVVLMIGLLTAVIAAVFTVILRTQPRTEARVDDARSLLGITTWFPSDVSSTQRRPTISASPDWWNVDAGTSSGCTGAPAGTNLIRLRWTETSAGSTTYEANYRLVNQQGWRILRVTCGLGQPATVQTLTSDLPDPSVSPITVSLMTGPTKADPLVTEVMGASMVIPTIDGETLRVDAVSEALIETLPTVPVAVTTTAVSTSTTTSTTTTTLPSSSTTSSTSSTSTTSTTTTVPCTAAFVSVAPNPVANQPKANGNNDTESQLSEAVTVAITKGAGCEGLALRYSRKADPYPPGQQVEVLFGAGTTITFQVAATERWEDGTHTLQLYDTIRLVPVGSATSLVVT